MSYCHSTNLQNQTSSFLFAYNNTEFLMNQFLSNFEPNQKKNDQTYFFSCDWTAGRYFIFFVAAIFFSFAFLSSCMKITIFAYIFFQIYIYYTVNSEFNI